MSTLTDRAAQFIDSFLEHAEPKYYDAAKAHEYYLRTRELKGRQTGEGLAENQKEAFNYSKSVINEAQQAELDAANEERQAEFDEVRQGVEVLKTEIKEKLTALLTELTDTNKAIREQIDAERDVVIAAINGKLREDLQKISERQSIALKKLAEKKKEELLQISEDAEEEIDALPPLPKGISPEIAARLGKARSEKIDKIRGETKSKKTSVSEQYDSDADSVRTSSRAEKDQVRDNASSEKESVNAKATEEQNAVSTEVANEKKLQRESSNAEREELTVAVREYVNDAAAKYEELRQDLVAKYEAETDAEYQAISETVRPVNKPKKAGASTSKAKKSTSKTGPKK